VIRPQIAARSNDAIRDRRPGTGSARASPDLEVVPVDAGAQAVELGPVPRRVHLDAAELVHVVVLLGRAFLLEQDQVAALRVGAKEVLAAFLGSVR